MRIVQGFWRTAILLTVALLFLLFVLLLACWQQLEAGQQRELVRLIGQNTGFSLLLLLLFGGSWLGGIAAVYHWWVKPVHALADELLLILSVNPGYRLTPGRSRGLVRLAALVNEGADRYQSLEKTAEERLTCALQTLRQERNILASVLASLDEGLVICTVSATVIYVNERGREFLGGNGGPSAEGKWISEAPPFIGPGRDLCECLPNVPLRTLLADIAERAMGASCCQGHHLTVIGPLGHYLAVDIAPLVLADELLAGYVVKLNPVSSENWPPATGKIPAPEANVACRRLREERAVCPEDCLTRGIRVMALSELLATVIEAAAATDKISLHAGTIAQSWQIGADRSMLVPAVCRLLELIAAESDRTDFFLRVHGEATEVCCEFTWGGSALADETVAAWMESVEIAGDRGLPALPIGLVMQTHGIRWTVESTVGQLGEGYLRLLIPRATERGRVNLAPVRLADGLSLFSDYDLYGTAVHSPELDQELLSNLTYTVFDLETTGLDPLTDEIISIGAVRCAHGKIVPGETFSTLVDPGREVPEESRRIHGLDRQALQGQPGIETVLPRFHRYAANTVLVGHNIAFDLRMLQMKRYVSPLRFSQPVLDTMVISAIIHPYHRNHSLEAVSRRLGVQITGRHTAMGDAIAAAEILNKSLPLLARANILTLADARRASQRTRYSRVVY